MKKLSFKKFNLEDGQRLSRDEKRNTIGGNMPSECHYVVCSCGTNQYYSSCDAGCPQGCWMGPTDPICWQYIWCL